MSVSVLCGLSEIIGYRALDLALGTLLVPTPGPRPPHLSKWHLGPSSTSGLSVNPTTSQHLCCCPRSNHPSLTWFVQESPAGLFPSLLPLSHLSTWQTECVTHCKSKFVCVTLLPPHSDQGGTIRPHPISSQISCAHALPSVAPLVSRYPHTFVSDLEPSPTDILRVNSPVHRDTFSGQFSPNL